MNNQRKKAFPLRACLAGNKPLANTPLSLAGAIKTAIYDSKLCVTAFATFVCTNSLASPFPAELDLSILLPGNGESGFVINQTDLPGASVSALSIVGDVNGDGIDDLIAGAPYSGEYGVDDPGQSVVLFGSITNSSSVVELSDLLSVNGGDGSSGFAINGVENGDRFGLSVADAGDVNNDGFDDIIVGARNSGPPNNEGQSYVVFGSDQGFSAEVEAADLSSMNGGDGSEGFQINGIDTFDRAGRMVSGAGDVNGDSIDDLMVSATYADPDGRSSAGEVYVIFGSTSAFPADYALSNLQSVNGGDGSAGFILRGIDAGDRIGNALAPAGDINGDGIDDFVIGAYGATGESYKTGECYVVFGNDQGFPAEMELSSLLQNNGGDGTTGLILRGGSGEQACVTLSPAGDVNGDGLSDLIIGTYQYQGGVRHNGPGDPVYVLFGKQSGFSAEIDLSSLGGAGGVDGFEIQVDQNDKDAVGGAGDVNGDGLDDVLVANRRADPNGVSNAGSVYVFYGRNQGFTGLVNGSDLLSGNGGDGSLGFVINGFESNASIGDVVSARGDINNDGIDDLLIEGGLNKTYAIYGRSSNDTDSDGIDDSNDNCLNQPNSAQVDIDGDGIGNACDADFNNDCIVNFLDISLFANEFLGTSPLFDIDSDGAVNFLDYSIVTSYFMLPPGPSGTTNLCE